VIECEQCQWHISEQIEQICFFTSSASQYATISQQNADFC